MISSILSMDTDPGILCFKHCVSKVFCFNLPDCCQVCGVSLASSEFQLEPFRIPYPFVRAVQHPCTIVMRPTNGDFLNDYQNSMDLHIGVTTSDGMVIEFDKNGLHKGDRTELWSQCLAIDCASNSWSGHWDSTLHDMCVEDCWSSFNYNENNFNCYTFVLKFLQNIDHNSFRSTSKSRTKFCDEFIVPRTTAAAKYISLYRKLHKSPSFVMM